MGVAIGRGGGYGIAIGISVAPAAVYYGAAVSIRAEWTVAVGIGQSVIALREPPLAVGGPATVDQHIFIINLAHRRGFVKSEHLVLFISGYEILHHIGAGLYSSHGGRVKFGSHGVAESPVAIHSPVIVDKHRRVKTQHSIGRVGFLLTPVYHPERSVGTFGARHHAVAASGLIVGIEIIHFLAVGHGLHSHIGRIEHIARAVGPQRLAVAVGARLEYHSVITPCVKRVGRRRPHYQIGAAIHGAQHIVRAVYIHSLLAGHIRVVKKIWLSVRYMFPKRKIGIDTQRILEGKCDKNQGEKAVELHGLNPKILELSMQT